MVPLSGRTLLGESWVERLLGEKYGAWLRTVSDFTFSDRARTAAVCVIVLTRRFECTVFNFFFFFRIVGWSYDFWVLFLSFIEQLQTRTWLTVNCSMMRLCHDENKTGFTNTINIRQLLIRLSTAQPFACFQLHPMNFKRKLHSWTAKRGSKYAPNGRRSKSGDLHNYVYSFTTGDSIIPF